MYPDVCAHAYRMCVRRGKLEFADLKHMLADLNEGIEPTDEEVPTLYLVKIRREWPAQYTIFVVHLHPYMFVRCAFDCALLVPCRCAP